MSHPLHPVFVHFPVACWSLGTLADITAYLFNDIATEFSSPLILAGLILAIPAMLTGLFEVKNTRGDSEAQETVMTHISYVLVTWTLYAASLYIRGLDMDSSLQLPLLFSIAGFISLGIAGWYGGKLVYFHGVGVERIKGED